MFKIITKINNRINYKIIPVFLILILSTILITGCDFSGPSVYNFRTGTDGLKLEIKGESYIELDEFLTSTVEEYEFSIENKGATDIDANDIYLRIKLDDFLKNKDDNNPKTTNTILLTSLTDLNDYGPDKLYGKSLYAKKGETARHYLDLETNTPPDSGVSTKITADLCYKYSTILSDSICINTIKHRDKQGCKKEHSNYPIYYYSSGQGAPIRINEVEIKERLNEKNQVNSILVINIDNPDGGITNLHDENEFEACKAKKEINQIKLKSVKLGNRDIKSKCNVENDIINLKDGDVKISCTLEDEEDIKNTPLGYLVSNLYIELDYDYHTSYRLDIDIDKNIDDY